MPNVVVDLSARSKHIREEPWHLHFWELKVNEALEYLRDPRGKLREMGIDLPEDCRIETTIDNHDWMAANSKNFAAEDGPIIICNVGGGNVAVNAYRVRMYAHHIDDVGRFEKKLLHEPEEEQQGEVRR